MATLPETRPRAGIVRAQKRGRQDRREQKITPVARGRQRGKVPGTKPDKDMPVGVDLLLAEQERKPIMMTRDEAVELMDGFSNPAFRKRVLVAFPQLGTMSSGRKPSKRKTGDV